MPNRALFEDRVGQVFLRPHGEQGNRFAVLFLDLDQFKLVNDSLGHSSGDRLLVEVARRLEESCREVDTVARLGGDEFALLLDGLDREADVMTVVGRIQEALRMPFTIKQREIYTSASIGIAFGRCPSGAPQDILRDADTAMYQAKQKGRGTAAVFDAAMHASVTARLDMEADFRRAIEGRELELFYQKIVSVSSGRTAGFEALVRWRHPRRGLLRPAEFL
ncbi:MAG: diguanylate cyclase, partial [bacterium]|nr:diguanylate cyclase [bacterium]